MYITRKEAVSETEDIPNDLQDESTTVEVDVEYYKIPAPVVTQASSGGVQTTEKVPKWFKMSK